MNLNKLIQGFSRGIISILTEDGYPISFPITNFRVEINKIIADFFRALPPKVMRGQPACILFHFHNEFVRKISSIRLDGEISGVDAGSFEFTPYNYYAFKQGGFFNTIRFIWDGKRHAKQYFKWKELKKKYEDED